MVGLKKRTFSSFGVTTSLYSSYNTLYETLSLSAQSPAALESGGGVFILVDGWINCGFS